eukprot:ANDGO_01253.mRNA.5 hypothetical protein
MCGVLTFNGADTGHSWIFTCVFVWVFLEERAFFPMIRVGRILRSVDHWKADLRSRLGKSWKSRLDLIVRTNMLVSSRSCAIGRTADVARLGVRCTSDDAGDQDQEACMEVEAAHAAAEAEDARLVRRFSNLDHYTSLLQSHATLQFRSRDLALLSVFSELSPRRRRESLRQAEEESHSPRHAGSVASSPSRKASLSSRPSGPSSSPRKLLQSKRDSMHSVTFDVADADMLDSSSSPESFPEETPGMLSSDSSASPKSPSSGLAVAAVSDNESASSGNAIFRSQAIDAIAAARRARLRGLNSPSGANGPARNSAPSSPKLQGSSSIRQSALEQVAAARRRQQQPHVQ